MLICKLVGSALLLFCGLMFPELWARRRQRWLEEEAALSALISYIRGQIVHGRLPIGEILLRCEEDFLGVKCREKKDLALLFEEADFQCRTLGGIAMTLAGELGKGYYEEQLALCDRYLGELTRFRTELIAECEKKGRTERAFSLFGSAVLVLLLL